ncbi:MAG: hypothetical protein HYU41_08655 [Candidatus Rokubacteria bacterium]|nr:hypothetical protein [Candidatus Rokubacteria bacterium]
MSRRSVTPRHADTPERSSDEQTIRARLFDVDVDRKKQIDDTIDYFGEGRARRSVVTSDPASCLGTGWNMR